MSDPTGYNDPRARRTDRTGANSWAWVAGIIALFLIVFIIFAYGNRPTGNSPSQSASSRGGVTSPAPSRPSSPAPATTGQGNH